MWWWWWWCCWLEVNMGNVSSLTQFDFLSLHLDLPLKWILYPFVELMHPIYVKILEDKRLRNCVKASLDYLVSSWFLEGSCKLLWIIMYYIEGHKKMIIFGAPSTISWRVIEENWDLVGRDNARTHPFSHYRDYWNSVWIFFFPNLTGGLLKFQHSSFSSEFIMIN